MLRLWPAQLDIMIAHARAELPNEACGILSGRNDTVQTVHCLENARSSPVAYELTAPGYLLLADLDDAGQLLAVFHSHPHADAYPSPTDRRQAAWDIRQVIIAPRAGKALVRVYRIVKNDRSDMADMGSVVEEELEIMTDGTDDARTDSALQPPHRHAPGGRTGTAQAT